MTLCKDLNICINMFILSIRVCFLAFVCCTFFLNLQYIFTIGQKWLNENYLWIMVCSWKCLYADCLSKCLYTDFRPLSKYVHVGASIWIFLIDRKFQCFNGCSSVHVNLLWTAGTQAPTAPRWPHHHECCMMGTWGDEIISKGNPIIFSPTLHLFHISSLCSSISPPSSKARAEWLILSHLSPGASCQTVILLTALCTSLCVSYPRTNESGLFSCLWCSCSGWQKTPASQAADIFSQKRWTCWFPISTKCEFLAHRKARKCHVCVC